ncbi:MAG: hypothetical protein MUC62_06995 [Candidatus Thermoplasmatota archaeon]|jgi:hypothetical protein|nr:hypothetical protein [Candidatus Thermoplasmatota archaeon]
MGKIERLTKDIEKYKLEIEKFEGKLVEAKELHKSGGIDKDKLFSIRHKYQEKIRSSQIAIRRKEKARLQIEKEIKENLEKEKEKGSKTTKK